MRTTARLTLSYTAISGEPSAVDWNPAGLAGVDRLRVEALHVEQGEQIRMENVLAALPQYGNSFAQFGLHQSKLHAAYFRAHPPTADEARHFNQMAQVSLDEQQEIERTQTGDFAEFIAAYQSSTLCKDCA